GTEQVDHWLIRIRDGPAQRVGGAFDFGVWVSSMSQEKLGNFVVTVGCGCIKCLAVRSDTLLSEIRIRTAIQQQSYDVDMSTGGCILYRRAGTNVIRGILRNPVGQRGVLLQERSHPLQIANARCRANVQVGAASD